MARRNHQATARDSRGSERDRQLRMEIAQMAAKLIVEHGIDDWGHAKRKAARQLGVNEQSNLPSADEVEQALREYISLFRPQSQAELLFARRNVALTWMKLLAHFSPRLTAGMATGLATSHSEIRLELVADDSKVIEMFMLARGIDFAPTQNGGDAMEGTQYLIETDDATLRLVVIPLSRRRNLSRERQAEQLDIADLQTLLSSA